MFYNSYSLKKFKKKNDVTVKNNMKVLITFWVNKFTIRVIPLKKDKLTNRFYKYKYLG